MARALGIRCSGCCAPQTEEQILYTGELVLCFVASLRDKLSKPEYLFSVLSTKEKIGLSECISGEGMGNMKDSPQCIYSPFTPILKHEVHQIPYCRTGIEASKILPQQAHK